MTAEQYEQMLKRQRERCAICGRPQSAFEQNLDVDHNHVTKEVRGLLCKDCNMVLGLVRDDPSVLRLAASYLEKACRG